MTIQLDKFIPNIFPDDLSQYVFLVGSGISVTSGLPSGWEFNKKIADYLSFSKEETNELLSMLTTDYKSSNHNIRFEQLMFVLKERIDHELNILNVFDGDSPTMIHEFLSNALMNNSFVFTTNFDSLIEASFYKHKSKLSNFSTLLQVFLEDEKEENDEKKCNSFERYIFRGLPQPALFKLHGTLRSINPKLNSLDYSLNLKIGATLDKLGSGGLTLRLEPNKHRTLELILQKRILCVIGYSGNDDFDVIPSIAEVISASSGLLWIRHENKDDYPMKVLKLDKKANTELLPEKIRNSTLPISSYIIRGKTNVVINKLFHYYSSQCDIEISSSIDSKLMSLSPYNSLKDYKKKIIAGRIAEEAMCLDIAIQKYNDALLLAQRKCSSTQAYALFRLGHISRVIGNNSDVLIYLKKSLKKFQRIKDQYNILLVLNSIGNYFLVIGELKKAETIYTKVLGELFSYPNKRLQATVLNNLGLVWKKKGEYIKAIEFYNRALEIDIELNDRHGMMRELGNKLNVFIKTGKYEDFFQISDQIAYIQELLGRTDLFINILISKGIAFCNLSELGKATKVANDALKIANDSGKKEDIALCLSLQGKISFLRKDWTKTIEYFTKSIDLQKKIGRLEGLAIDLENLGNCYFEMKDFENAIKSLNESHNYYHKLGNIYEVDKIEKMIINIKSKM